MIFSENYFRIFLIFCENYLRIFYSFITVGKPIEVSKEENPSTEMVEKLKEIYIEKLTELYNENKARFGYEHVPLVIK